MGIEIRILGVIVLIVLMFILLLGIPIAALISTIGCYYLAKDYKEKKKWFLAVLYGVLSLLGIPATIFLFIDIYGGLLSVFFN